MVIGDPTVFAYFERSGKSPKHSLDDLLCQKYIILININFLTHLINFENSFGRSLQGVMIFHLKPNFELHDIWFFKHNFGYTGVGYMHHTHIKYKLTWEVSPKLIFLTIHIRLNSLKIISKQIKIVHKLKHFEILLFKQHFQQLFTYHEWKVKKQSTKKFI